MKSARKPLSDKAVREGLPGWLAHSQGEMYDDTKDSGWKRGWKLREQAMKEGFARANGHAAEGEP